MNSRDFCFWLQGFVELSELQPPNNRQWDIIIDHLLLPDRTDEEHQDFNNFVSWLTGFEVAIKGEIISTTQWTLVTERLQSLFTKITGDEVNVDELDDVGKNLRKLLERSRTSPDKWRGGIIPSNPNHPTIYC